jgi:hypothetical protein
MYSKNAIKLCNKSARMPSNYLEGVGNEIQRHFPNKEHQDLPDWTTCCTGRYIGKSREDYYLPLNATSSDGFPYVQMNKPLLEYFERDGMVLTRPTTFCIAELESLEDEFRQGKRGEVYFSLQLKDETREIEKIKAGKTRVFMSSPKTFTILCRKYLMDFVIMLHKIKIKTPMSVGIDPTSFEWTRLTERLLEVGDKTVWTDATNWDASCTPELLQLCYTLVQNWYDDEYGEIRRCIFRELAFTRFVVKDQVYMKNAGLPSGCFGTAEFNSIINWAIHLYFYQRMVECYSLDYQMYDFDHHCRLSTYGDDVVLTVHKDISEYFTPAFIRDSALEIGFFLTSGDKSEMGNEFHSLENVTFLKRDFKPFYYDNMKFFVGRLEMDSIRNSIMWINRQSNEEEDLRQTINNALSEIWKWGKEEYEDFKSKLKLSNFDLNKVLTYHLTWEQRVEGYIRRCSKQHDYLSLHPESSKTFDVLLTEFEFQYENLRIVHSTTPKQGGVLIMDNWWIFGVNCIPKLNKTEKLKIRQRIENFYKYECTKTNEFTNKEGSIDNYHDPSNGTGC